MTLVEVTHSLNIQGHDANVVTTTACGATSNDNVDVTTLDFSAPDKIQFDC